MFYMKKKDSPTDLHTIIGSVFKQLDGAPQREQLRIWDIWEEAVGPRIAERAQPETLRNSVLVVSVSSSVWMQELSFFKQKILDRLQQKLAPGMIKDIRFKLGATQKDRAGGYGSAPPPELSAEEQEMIARQTASIQDPELRESLRDLFIAGRRQKKKREDL